MPQIINTNISSLKIQSNLNKSQESLNTSLDRLSSGLRINSARDDAAGLSIANTFTSQIRGLNQAIRNANDGIALSQVAEGALQESTNILQRIRELAIQSANGTNTGIERALLQQEVSQLQAELNRIAATTSFGNRLILDGSFGTDNFQIGAKANQTISVSLGGVSSRDLGAQRIDLDGSSVGVALPAANNIPGNNIQGTDFTINGGIGTSSIVYQAGDSASKIARAVNLKSGETGVFAEARTIVSMSNFSSSGLVGFSLRGTGSSLVSISATLTSTTDLSGLALAINQQSATTGVSARSEGDTIKLINDAGDDIEISSFSGGTVDVIARNFDDTGNSGVSRTLNVGGVADSSRIIGQVRVESSAAFSFSGVDSSVTNDNDSSLASIDLQSVGSQNSAQAFVSVIDSSIRAIDSMRAGIGAVQNRLQSTITNLQNISENASSARSRIQDADFAVETANLTRTQILQQAGIAILAQANAIPQQVLSLLNK
jgi:flagellin